METDAALPLGPPLLWEYCGRRRGGAGSALSLKQIVIKEGKAFENWDYSFLLSPRLSTSHRIDALWFCSSLSSVALFFFLLSHGGLTVVVNSFFSCFFLYIWKDCEIKTHKTKRSCLISLILHRCFMWLYVILQRV